VSQAKGIRHDLVTRIAQMGAHRVTLRAARASLIQRAHEQLDAMAPTVAELERAVEAGKGGILSQRRLRTLLKERERLQRVIADDQERRDRERTDT
jgi:hypothetical protein